MAASRSKTILRWALTVFMVGAGAYHFINPDMYLAMMPPQLPAHRALVAVSGVFEILGGLGLILPQTRRLAAWGLIALFVCVFPANLNMALHDIPLNGHPLAPWQLWGRLPLQLVFIVWAFWFTRPD